MNFDELLSIKILPDEISSSEFEIREKGIYHTPYRDEIRIFSCIKEGNLEKLIDETKNYKDNSIFVGRMSDTNIMQYRYMAVSMITLATRYAIQGGLNENDAYTFSDKFIQQIDKLNSPDEIIGYMISRIISLTNLVKSCSQKAKHSPYIRKAVIYINQNLNRKISVSQVAKHCGVSADYISHLFKKETGENMSSYIRKQKLEAAKTMIFDGFDNGKICYSLGFCSQSYFISSFKKEFGITPYEYAAMIK